MHVHKLKILNNANNKHLIDQYISGKNLQKITNDEKYKSSSKYVQVYEKDHILWI